MKEPIRMYPSPLEVRKAQQFKGASAPLLLGLMVAVFALASWWTVPHRPPARPPTPATQAAGGSSPGVHVFGNMIPTPVRCSYDHWGAATCAPPGATLYDVHANYLHAPCPADWERSAARSCHPGVFNGAHDCPGCEP